MKSTKGFTLVEIIVAVSVVAILASMLVVGMLESGQHSRDSDRQANLRLVQNALDLYKNKYGRYPEGCNGPNRWSAQTVTVGVSPNRCSDGSFDYIRNLAPEFIPTLPIENKPNGDNSGYMYYVNADGSTFKFLAFSTVESEIVTLTHPFKPCDTGGVCASTATQNGWSGGTPVGCRVGEDSFRYSYAVWGGYPRENPNFPETHARGQQYLEAVICQMP